ncbi:hypothetical protein ABE488_00880 [Luteimonas sp. TWI662]|uniref:hypothetical protein n=1 Tax=Luteimonas sp. TWI662 TaxID=3136789 RepID=UPI003207C49A
MAADGNRCIIRGARPTPLTAAERARLRWQQPAPCRRWLTERRAFRLFYAIGAVGIYLGLQTWL